MKRKLTYLILAAALCLTFVLLTAASCGGNNTGGTGNIPTLESVSAKRQDSNYQDSENILCLEVKKPSGSSTAVCEQVVLTIKFINKDKLPFVSLKVNGDTYQAKDFTADNNNETLTLVYRPKETSGDLKITVNEIYYKRNSANAMISARSLSNNYVDVKIAPKFDLTVVIETGDAVNLQSEARTTGTVDFMKSLDDVNWLHTAGEMNHPLISTTSSSINITNESYYFVGWFTEPDGGGKQVLKNGKYEFYSDITVYAYYQPFYEYEILTDETANGYAVITNLTEYGKAESGILRIFDTIDGYEIRALGKSAMFGAAASHIVLTENITEIGESAFRALSCSFTLGKKIEKIGAYAFYMCTGITGANVRFYIPSSVKEIGDYAFYGTGWNTYYIANAVVENVSGGVKESSLGNSLVIPESVQKIGKYAFANSTFEAVYFMNGSQITLAGMGEYAFANSTALKRVRTAVVIANNIPRNIEEENEQNAVRIIGNAAFKGCIALTEITLSEGLITIGDEAFSVSNALGMVGITALKIPKSVATIGQSAFVNFKRMTKLEFADGSNLKTIGDYAFQSSALTDVDIKSTVLTDYGASPFWGSNSLSVIRLSAPGPAFGGRDKDQGFVNLEYLKYLVPADAINHYKAYWRSENILGAESNFRIYPKEDMYYTELEKYWMGYEQIKDKDGNLNGLRLTYLFQVNHIIESEIHKDAIPKEIWGIPIIAIGKYVAHKDVVKITLPDTVETIEAEAFYGCQSLKTINLNDLINLRVIEEYAFARTAITNFASNDALKEIQYRAFYFCEALEGVDLQKGEIKIGADVFTNGGLRRLRLGENIKEIGAAAFAQCTSLMGVYMELTTPPSMSTLSPISPFNGSGAGTSSKPFVIYVYSEQAISNFKANSYYNSYYYKKFVDGNGGDPEFFLI